MLTHPQLLRQLGVFLYSDTNPIHLIRLCYSLWGLLRVLSDNSADSSLGPCLTGHLGFMSLAMIEKGGNGSGNELSEQIEVESEKFLHLGAEEQVKKTGQSQERSERNAGGTALFLAAHGE